MEVYEAIEQTLTCRFCYGVHRRHFKAHRTKPGDWRSLPFLAIVTPFETDYHFHVRETDTTYTAHSEELVFVPAHMAHSLNQPAAGRHSAAHIQYSMLGALDPLSLFVTPHHLDCRQAGPIREVLFSLILGHQRSAVDLGVVLERKEMGFRLLRLILEHSRLKAEKADLLGHFARLEPVLAYIENHLGESISRDYLAEIACLSLTRFNLLFRETMGLPPQKYVQSQRQKKAMELLGSTDLSIAQVAERTGYCDQFHFSRQFRKVLGVTPTAYRAALRRHEWAFMAPPGAEGFAQE